MAAKKPSFSRGEKVFLLSMTTFVLVVAAIALWQQSLNTIPPIKVPTPVMPSPNALDYYVKAGNSLVPYNITLANGEQYPLNLSATIIEKIVMDGKHLGKDAGIARSLGPGTPNRKTEPSLAEMRQLLLINAPAFATLREGFQYKYREPPARSFSHLFIHHNKLHKMAQALAADAYVKRESGDWNGAVNACLDCIRLGEDTPHGANMMGLLVGVSIQGIGRTNLWPIIDHLDASQARAAARRMEDTMAHQVPCADVLQEEKWGAQAALLEMFRKPGWRKEMARLVSEDSSSDGLTVARAYCTGKGEIIREYTKYMDGIIANARLPYAASKVRPPLPKNPISRVMAPAFAKAPLKYVVTNTEAALLTVSFALRAYKAEHGQYPTSLSALTPGYLRTIPADPFALKGTLRYKRVGAHYVLYSIGLDGKDDGGTPSADGRARPHVPRGTPQPQWQSLSRDSKGDIVAGVNVY